MTLKEKARRYDEAIKMARKIHAEKRAQPFNIMASVFLEIKEEQKKNEEKKDIMDLIEYFDSKLIQASRQEAEGEFNRREDILKYTRWINFLKKIIEKHFTTDVSEKI